MSKSQSKPEVSKLDSNNNTSVNEITTIWTIPELILQIFRHAHWRDIIKFRRVAKLYNKLLTEQRINELLLVHPVSELKRCTSEIVQYPECTKRKYPFRVNKTLESLDTIKKISFRHYVDDDNDDYDKYDDSIDSDATINIKSKLNEGYYRHAVFLDFRNFAICSMTASMISPCIFIQTKYVGVNYCQGGCYGFKCLGGDFCVSREKQSHYISENEGYYKQCYCQPQVCMNLCDFLEKIDNRAIGIYLSHMYINLYDDGNIINWFATCTADRFELSCSTITFVVASRLTKCKNIYFKSVLLVDGSFADLQEIYDDNNTVFSKSADCYDMCDIRRFQKRVNV